MVYWKYMKKGVGAMCKIMKDMRNEVEEKAELKKSKKRRKIRVGKCHLKRLHIIYLFCQ